MVELAQAMGISESQIYRVRQGKRGINQKFIIGAIKAFPGYKLDDLLYAQGTDGRETPDRPDDEAKDQIMNLLLRHPDMGYEKIGSIVHCSRQRVHLRGFLISTIMSC